MDAKSRETASTYINNLLLSRGLLRNGNPIAFARPEATDGGINATMTQVMNLVHDLVLRRDRETDSLSHLSQSMQNLRQIMNTQTQSITRLEARNTDLERSLALSRAQERAASATLQSAESRNRALREEMARLKNSLAQIRAQCATDLRRRDGEIARLKKHLDGRRGREGGSSQVGVVIVTPGMNRRNQSNNRGTEGEAQLDSPEYSLKQESTDFLTELSQRLSDENDALIGLVRGTLATLRTLQGLPADPAGSTDAAMGLEGITDSNGVIMGPPSCEVLATSIDDVLEHLRALLTNPSFVPLEEVQVREEEIHRLREGWEKMAMKWKEAVSLIGGWKRRMVDEGDTIGLEDLKAGLQLGSGIPSAEEAHQSPFKVGSLMPDDGGITDPADVPIPEDLDLLHEESECAFLEVTEEDLAPSVPDTALMERNANPRLAPSPQKAPIPVIDEEEPRFGASEDKVSLIEPASKAAGIKPTNKSRLPQQVTTRINSPEKTIAQKLEQAQREAEDVKRRQEEKKTQQAVKTMPHKRTAPKKVRGSRRRSTLSPEELENLMGIH